MRGAAAGLCILLCIVSVRLLAISEETSSQFGAEGLGAEEGAEDTGSGSEGGPLEGLPGGASGPVPSGAPGSDEPSE